VFLDRDGTIIEEVHYIADPATVRLLPGAAEGLRLLRGAGLACVVVSNQSAVGRGMITVEDVRRVQAEVERHLALAGTALDGFYFCPEPPRSGDRTAVEHPDRKPGPGMLLRAARELGLDIARSWAVGDMISDLLAGRNAGCRGTILVRTGYGARSEADAGGAADVVLDDLAAAARHILNALGQPDAGPSRGLRLSERAPNT
jgi:D-glycero-D-manno-heptose 1,7-bisphosphate phosphatase